MKNSLCTTYGLYCECNEPGTMVLINVDDMKVCGKTAFQVEYISWHSIESQSQGTKYKAQSKTAMNYCKHGENNNNRLG